ncbi:hypothetical protein COEREDRAFT_79088 [Coemansia reversa NRRL 1564]|uniref:Nucleoside transporter n=1 Tax=Coemansia reversa (strain ATCC 12441 / NRRL 1564) TaxID=763665 RepID=A0A2G5BJC0_COERN|nr:hypothetical protein COEREDRAFT_79088 [Coemansia reversa NRRL 1564]|eukprot:PIA19110.1 hypothetical protein COEREDRAFT_79088 [Coemansia reversa NRRL 1564]
MAEAGSARFLYWRFVVLGTATLVAWNVYIVSSDFFRSVLRDTPFRNSFESIFSVLSNTTNMAALCYALYTQPSADHDRRIRNGLMATAASFCTVALLAVFEVEGLPTLVVILLSLGVAAVAAAYIQCSIFGIVALLPPYCAEGFMSGQAIAGTIASAIQLVTIFLSSWGEVTESNRLVATKDDGNRQLRLRTASYFCASALFLGLSVGYWRELNAYLACKCEVPDALITNDPNLLAAVDDNLNDELAGIMHEESPRISRNPSVLLASEANHHPITASSPVIPNSHPLRRVSEAVSNRFIGEQSHNLAEITVVDQIHRQIATPTAGDAQITNTSAMWLSTFGLHGADPAIKTLSEIAPFAFISAVVMAQTLAVFPPLTEAIVSSSKSFPQIGHLAAWHFLLFNVGDYLGRLSTQWLNCQSLSMLKWINHCRWLLVVAVFMFPTAATLPQRWLVVHSDLLFLALVFVLGWSNGWIATISLIEGPHHATNKELAGSILGFAMCIGLVIGAIASYPVLFIAGIS